MSYFMPIRHAATVVFVISLGIITAVVVLVNMESCVA